MGEHPQWGIKPKTFPFFHKLVPNDAYYAMVMSSVRSALAYKRTEAAGNSIQWCLHIMPHFAIAESGI